MRDTIRKMSVQYIEVSAADAGQRLDNFLLRHLKGVPRSKIYRIVRKGEVRINKGRAKPDYKLTAGDSVRIPPVRVSDNSTTTPSQRLIAQVTAAIVYEDAHVLVLNKPAGIAVHAGSGVAHGVIEALRAARGSIDFLELVHRIDRDTSGCLVLAKSRSVLRQLHDVWRDGEQLKKRYLALVAGHWNDAGYIKSTLRRGEEISGERKVVVEEDGKAALSYFKPLQHYRMATLLEVQIYTGRTHQIRVQTAEAGHPIAGDHKYGDRQFNKTLAKSGFKRMFLHANSLEFVLPETGEMLHLSAPLDDTLRHLLDELE